MHQQVTLREERHPVFLITQLNLLTGKAGRLEWRAKNSETNARNRGEIIVCTG